MSKKKYIAIPPGATIIEQLNDRNINKKEFAKKMNMTDIELEKLLNGELIITKDIANRLENALGIPAHFWVNLEKIYREKLSISLNNAIL